MRKAYFIEYCPFSFFEGWATLYNGLWAAEFYCLFPFQKARIALKTSPLWAYIVL